MTNDERHPTGLLHSADELCQLIRENPTLPLLVFAGEEAVADSLADSDYTDEEFDALLKKTVAEYDPYWKPCIILNVDN